MPINFVIDEFKENSELIDIWRLSARYKEEILLSESDMKSFIKSTELRIDSLRQSRVHLESVTDESYSAEALNIFAKTIIYKSLLILCFIGEIYLGERIHNQSRN